MKNLERRSFILTAASAVAAAAVFPRGIFAAGTGNGSGATGPTYSSPEALKALSEINQATSDCMKKGQACADHCKKELSEGHTLFEKCYSSIQAMMALCGATNKLAEIKSTRTAQILDLCISALETCRDACLEHKAHFAHGMHLECRDCAEACSNCITHCKAAKAALTSAA